MYVVITLCTLNLYSAVCQLHLNKTVGKIDWCSHLKCVEKVWTNLIRKIQKVHCGAFEASLVHSEMTGLLRRHFGEHGWAGHRAKRSQLGQK